MRSVRAGARLWSCHRKPGRLGRVGLVLVPAALALLAAGCHAAPAGPGQAVNQQITVAACPGSRTRRCRWRSATGCSPGITWT